MLSSLLLAAWGFFPQEVDHVVVVSVDGLRSDALVFAGPEQLPNFHRLLSGAFTLNARTDPDAIVTLPNHVGMLTGRLMKGPQGHGWTSNASELPSNSKIEDAEGRGIAGMFGVAAIGGVKNILVAGKSKFSLFQQSWPQDLPKAHVRSLDSLDNLRAFEGELSDATLQHLNTGGSRTLSFLHYPGPDVAGHSHGWKLQKDSEYIKAIVGVDKELGRLFEAFDTKREGGDISAVILTSDHGGGAPHYSHKAKPGLWVNYIIPFAIWRSDGKAKGDLYALNARTRKEPGIKNPPETSEAMPPIRNAEAANIALQLLGLKSIPGSTVNTSQNLHFGIQAQN